MTSRDPAGRIRPLPPWFRGAALAALAGACLVLLGTPPTAAAGPVHDPFLERFRAGLYRDPSDLDLQDGWPRDLLEPSRVDAVWLDVARACLGEHELPREDRLLTWRLLLPAVGSAARAESWRAERLALLDALEAAAPPGPDWLEAPPGDPWLKDVVVHAALHAAAGGRPAPAADLLRRGLARAAALGLSAEEVLVWSLRVRLLEERLAGAAATTLAEPLWPELEDLGPYDVHSGWALWLARRRARGESLLPGGGEPAAAVQLLLRLGAGWARPQELAGWGFTDDESAALGAVLLAEADLPAHFARYPDPPRDGALQSAWVRGQRRLHRGDTSRYEDLARRTDLGAALRADLWRRASEIHLIAGRWEPGLASLHEALLLVSAGVGDPVARQVRVWSEQVMALAAARARPDEGRRAAEMALELLPGDAAELFVAGSQTWLRDLGRPEVAPVPVDARERAAARVRQGGAAPVDRGPLLDLPARQAALADSLWREWARWGVSLHERGGARSDQALEYVASLQSLPSLAPGRERHAAACAAVGRYLARSELVGPLLGWIFTEDVLHAAAGGIRPEPSPIPRLVGRLRARGDRGWLTEHALLGFALAAGDARGTVAVAIGLRSAGDLDADAKRLFLYPLPGPGPVLDAVAAAPVETALLLATARNESLFEPAVRSRAGALGWLQVMPFHFAMDSLVGDGPAHWSQAGHNIALGGALMAENLQRYDFDPYRALAAYNAGPGAVDRWVRQLGGRTDPELFVSWIGYAETRGYVPRVLTDREIYRGILQIDLPDPGNEAGR
ncbi:MAG: lytic transglycosylase domain-containing protein [Candidatus Krumholzibacteriia bacterium]